MIELIIYLTVEVEVFPAIASCSPLESKVWPVSRERLVIALVLTTNLHVSHCASRNIG